MSHPNGTAPTLSGRGGRTKIIGVRGRSKAALLNGVLGLNSEAWEHCSSSKVPKGEKKIWNASNEKLIDYYKGQRGYSPAVVEREESKDRLEEETVGKKGPKRGDVHRLLKTQPVRGEDLGNEACCLRDATEENWSSFEGGGHWKGGKNEAVRDWTFYLNENSPEGEDLLVGRKKTAEKTQG